VKFFFIQACGSVIRFILWDFLKIEEEKLFSQKKNKKTFLDFVTRGFSFPKVMNLNKKKNTYEDLKFVNLEF